MIFIVNTEIKNNKKSKNKVFTLNTKVVVSAIGFLIPENQLKKSMLGIKKFSLQIHLEVINEMITSNNFC